MFTSTYISAKTKITSHLLTIFFVCCFEVAHLRFSIFCCFHHFPGNSWLGLLGIPQYLFKMQIHMRFLMDRKYLICVFLRLSQAHIMRPILLRDKTLKPEKSKLWLAYFTGICDRKLSAKADGWETEWSKYWSHYLSKNFLEQWMMMLWLGTNHY